MDLIDLTMQEIYNFMIKNKIPISKVELRYNGDDFYKVDYDLTDKEKELLESKLQALSKIEEKIKLLVKQHYGSFEKMDIAIGIKGHRAKFKRSIKSNDKLYSLIHAEINIKSK